MSDLGLDPLDEYHVTAIHESGHAVFAVAHGIGVYKIEASKGGEGVVRGGWELEPPGLAGWCYSEGGTKWEQWCTTACGTVASLFAGQLAELQFRNEPWPDSLIRADSHAFTPDILRAETIVELWYEAINGEVDHALVSLQLDRLETYTKSAFDREVSDAVRELSHVLIRHGGNLVGDEIPSASDLAVSARTIPDDLLQFPQSLLDQE